MIPEWDFKVIIVNDCSTKDDYEDIPSLFQSFLDITLLNLPENHGPGYARQSAIDLCTTTYIMFVDAGDVISFNNDFMSVMEIVVDNPDIKLFSCGHEGYVNENESVYEGPEHNKIHGKIYQLDFLRKYHIEFIKEHYYSEDIGFNTACRFICRYLEKVTGKQHFLELDMPITVELFDRNSITRKDNAKFKYFEGLGFGFNAIHSFLIAFANQVPKSFLEIEIYYCLVLQYIFFYQSYEANVFVEENMEGALALYKFYKQTFPNFNKDFLIEAYQTIMSTIVYSSTWNFLFDDVIPALSIWDFLDLLEEKSKEEVH